MVKNSRRNKKLNYHKKRVRIWNATDGCCSLCGEPVEFEEMTLDHLYPRILVGNPPYNYVPSHDSCNTVKDSRLPTRLELERWCAMMKRLYEKPDRRMWKLVEEHGLFDSHYQE